MLVVRNGINFVACARRVMELAARAAILILPLVLTGLIALSARHQEVAKRAEPDRESENQRGCVTKRHGVGESSSNQADVTEVI